MAITQRSDPQQRRRAAAAAISSSAFKTSCGSFITQTPYSKAAHATIRVNAQTQVGDRTSRSELVEEVPRVGSEPHRLQPADPVWAGNQLGNARASRRVEPLERTALGKIALEMPRIYLDELRP